MKRIIAASAVCALLLSAPLVFAGDKPVDGLKADPAKTEGAPAVKKTVEPGSLTLKTAPEVKPLEVKGDPSKSGKAADTKAVAPAVDKAVGDKAVKSGGGKAHKADHTDKAVKAKGHEVKPESVKPTVN